MLKSYIKSYVFFFIIIGLNTLYKLNFAIVMRIFVGNICIILFIVHVYFLFHIVDDLVFRV